jgi:hypothetical protein
MPASCYLITKKTQPTSPSLTIGFYEECLGGPEHAQVWSCGSSPPAPLRPKIPRRPSPRGKCLWLGSRATWLSRRQSSLAKPTLLPILLCATPMDEREIPSEGTTWVLLCSAFAAPCAGAATVSRVAPFASTLDHLFILGLPLGLTRWLDQFRTPLLARRSIDGKRFVKARSAEAS